MGGIILLTPLRTPLSSSEVMEHHKEGYESDVDERMSGCSSPSSDQGSVYSAESSGPLKLRLKKLSVGEGTVASPITVLSSDEEDGGHSIVTPSTPTLSSLNSFSTSIPRSDNSQLPQAIDGNNCTLPCPLQPCQPQSNPGPGGHTTSTFLLSSLPHEGPRNENTEILPRGV